MENIINTIYFSYDEHGYYKGPTYDKTTDSVVIEPEISDGFWPRWNGSAWEQVENHVGESGWCNEQPHTIAKYGPYPVGWSDTPPPPTQAEIVAEHFATLRLERDSRLDTTDKYLLADFPISPEKLEEIKVYRQILRDIPQQEGTPWDGGGELTPWPILPDMSI